MKKKSQFPKLGPASKGLILYVKTDNNKIRGCKLMETALWRNHIRHQWLRNMSYTNAMVRKAGQFRV